jgi:hypothetical protein
MANLPGGWTGFNCTISKEDEAVFKKALSGIVGVGYRSLAVARQVVSGVNFCFLSEAMPVYPNAEQYVVKIYIYQPVQGDPHIMFIEKVLP